MNQRTRVLGIGFGAVVAFAMVVNVVYPRWIEPLVTLDRRMAAAQERLVALQKEEERVERDRAEYRALVGRVGTFDIDHAATEVRDRINALIDAHHLRADSVTPSRSRKDRKTAVESMTINVKAVGSLESAIGFLADLYELPQFMRVGDVSIYRGSPGRDYRGPTPMNLRVPIEIRLLPQRKIVGHIELGALSQPEKLARHEPRDYSPIWTGTPFDDWVPPVPLRVKITASKTSVHPGDRVWLQGGVVGGFGEHTFEWSPTKGLKTPKKERTEIDTTQPGTHTYTLMATDEKGETARDTVTVSIVAKPGQVARGPKSPRTRTAPPAADARWQDRMHRQLVMTLGRSSDEGRLDELMIGNRRSHASEYYAVGDDFDGGTLVYVHQTGGLVRRKDDPRNAKGQVGYYVYPIGETLDKDVPVAQAEGFPELQRAAALDKATATDGSVDPKVEAARPVQPRGIERAPVQIGVVEQTNGAASPRGLKTPGKKAAPAPQVAPARQPRARRGRAHGRRPVRAPQ